MPDKAKGWVIAHLYSGQSSGSNKIVVLIGENGAGKSTMTKMLAGVEAPSSGQILLNGKPVTFNSTQQAESHGISIIFQELNRLLVNAL